LYIPVSARRAATPGTHLRNPEGKIYHSGST